MFKLRRLYIDSVGSEKIIYSNALFDFTSQFNPSQSVRNAIINGRNGGGKTTLLSYFFTLFEPRKDLFIQHLQKETHKFDEYFLLDAGLILAEFAPYQEDGVELQVIGQYIYKKPDKTTDRYFFHVSSSLGAELFDQVPSIGRGNLITKKDILHYLNSEGVFYTQDQRDWQQRLITLGFDLEQIRTQIGFCRTEGGIDKFADFKTEDVFLEKFLSLTMSESGEDEVRTQIANTITANKKLPQLEAQVDSLEELIQKINAFITSNERQKIASTELYRLGSKAYGLQKFASNQKIGLSGELKSLQNEITKIEELLANLKTDKNQSTLKKHLLELWINEDALAEQEKNLSDKQKELAGHIRKKYLCELAPDMIDIDTDRDVLKMLMDQYESASNEIKPLHDKLKNLYAQLYWKLNRKIHQQQTTIQNHEHKNVENEQTINGQKQVKREAEDTITELRAVIMSLDEFRKRMETERESLYRDKILSVYQSNAAAQLNRKKLELVTATTTLSAYKEQSANNIVEQQEARIALKSLENKRTQDLLEKQRNELLLNQHNSAEDELKRSYFKYFSVALADPYDSAASAEITTVINQSEESRRKLGEQKYPLVHELSLLSDGGSLLTDQAVIRLKAALEDVGVNCIFAIDYLNNVCNRDVHKIAGIVKSNPSRYLGLMVYKTDDLERIKAITDEMEIVKPVCISLVSIDTEDMPADVIIVGPSNENILSSSAREDRIEQIRKEILYLDQQIYEANITSNMVLNLKKLFEDFGNKYHKTQIIELKQKFREQENNLLELNQMITDATVRVEKLDVTRVKIQVEIETNTNISAQLNTQINRLQSYVQNYESQEVKKNNDYKTAESDLAKQRLLVESIEKDIQDIYEKIRRNQETISKTEGEINNLKVSLESLNIAQQQLDEYPEDPDFKANRSIDEIQQLIGNVQIQINRQTAELSLEEQKRYIDNAEAQLTRLLNNFGKKKAQHNHNLSKHTPRQAEITDDEIKIFKGTKSGFDELAKLGSNFDTAARTVERDINNIQNEIERLKPLIGTGKELTKKKQYVQLVEDGFVSDDLKDDLSQVNKQLQQIANQELESTSDLTQKKDSVTEMNKRLYEFERPLTKLDALVELVGDKDMKAEPIPFVPSDFDNVFTVLQADIKGTRKVVDDYRKDANDKYSDFAIAVRSSEFKETNKEIIGISALTIDELSNSHEQLIQKLMMKINIISDAISSSAEDIKLAVQVLRGKVKTALRKIKEASMVTVPSGCGEISGMPVIKLSEDAKTIVGLSDEKIDGILASYIRSYISKKDDVFPRNLLMESLSAIIRGVTKANRMGIRLLLVMPKSHDYYYIDEMRNSGGERVTSALLLFVTVSAMSSKTPGRSGGFLVMDNIFGSSSASDFTKTQVDLAAALKFQLISTTGINDRSFMVHYDKIISFKAGLSASNSKQRCVTEKTVFNGEFVDIDDSDEDAA